MKLLIKIGYLGVFIALLSGCFSGNLSFDPSNTKKINANLPILKNIKALSDVTSVGFEWEKIENLNDIKGFALFRADQKGVFKEVKRILQKNATHLYDSNLKPMTQYTYMMTTIGNDDRLSPTSKSITIKTSFINPVENVYAIGGLPRQIKLIWVPSPNPSIVEYKIERRDLKGGFKTIGKVKNRLYVEYFDNKLEDGKTYTYRIKAVSFDNIESIPSTMVTAITKNPPTPAINITASDDKAKQIIVKWNNSETKDVNRYKIYMSKHIDSGYKYLGTSNGNSYVAKVSEDNATRYFKVTPVDKDNIEGVMPKLGVKGMTIDPPTTPTIMQATIKDNQVTLVWSKPKDARIVGYVVRREEGKVIGTTTSFIGITDTTFVDKEVKAGETYRYTVSSIDDDNVESKPSREVVLSIDKLN